MRRGWLFCLLLVTFAVGTDDFVVAGVLPGIARDLGVGEPAAGQLVSVFSVIYALAARAVPTAAARPRSRLGSRPGWPPRWTTPASGHRSIGSSTLASSPSCNR